MGNDSQGKVFCGDPGPVVDDTDRVEPPLLEVNLDAGGPPIEGILDKLFDDTGRTFDDLAGGDLVDQGVGEELDGTTICHESVGFYH